MNIKNILCSFLWLAFISTYGIRPVYASWAHVSEKELVKQAHTIVVGKVIKINGEVGQRTALFEIEEVLKGNVPDQPLAIPFKETITWACDFTTNYDLGSKYLLLLEKKENQWAPVYYPGGVIIKSERSTTTLNIKRFIKINETNDKEELRKLYLAIFRSQESPFFLEAYDALKRLNFADHTVLEEVLLESLSKGNDWDTDTIIRELAQLKSQKAIDLFIDIARSGKPEHARQEAIQALGKLKVEKAVDLLMGIAKDHSDSWARRTALDSLVEISGPGIKEHFIRQLEDEKDPEVRATLLRHVAALGHPLTLGQALKALDSSNSSERRAAYNALMILKQPQVFSELVERLETVKDEFERKSIAKALLEIDTVRAVPHLIRLLKKSDPRVQSDIVELLGRSKSSLAYDTLLQLLNDKALEITPDMATGSSITGLDLDRVSMVAKIGNSLLKINSQKALPHVLSLVRHPNSYLRYLALVTLGESNITEAFQPLAQMLEKGKAPENTTKILLKLDYERAVPIVLGHIRQNEEVLNGTLEFLLEQGDPNIRLLESRFKDLSEEDLARHQEEITQEVMKSLKAKTSNRQ